MFEELTDRLEERDWETILLTAVYIALPLILTIALVAQWFLGRMS